MGMSDEDLKMGGVWSIWNELKVNQLTLPKDFIDKTKPSFVW